MQTVYQTFLIVGSSLFYICMCTLLILSCSLTVKAWQIASLDLLNFPKSSQKFFCQCCCVIRHWYLNTVDVSDTHIKKLDFFTRSGHLHTTTRRLRVSTRSVSWQSPSSWTYNRANTEMFICLCLYLLFLPYRVHMSSAAGTVENASIISESVAHDGNRLWIGNIDPKITEWVNQGLISTRLSCWLWQSLFLVLGWLKSGPSYSVSSLDL